jgi:hypothetical protein
VSKYLRRLSLIKAEPQERPRGLARAVFHVLGIAYRCLK